MGLDVYVGTLTRYYAGAWKTIAHQTMEAQGMPFTTVRSNASPDDVTDPKVIEPAVRHWQRQVAGALKAQSASSLDWTEGMSAPYFTDQPYWDGYGAVVLLAAYSTVGKSLPKEVSREWETDPAIAEAKARKAYRQILEPEWWLPFESDLVFACATLSGQSVQVGSSTRLRDELHALARAALSGSEAELPAWRRDVPDPPGSDFRLSARFGLAILAELSTRAVEHRLPMLLDY